MKKSLITNCVLGAAAVALVATAGYFYTANENNVAKIARLAEQKDLLSEAEKEDQNTAVSDGSGKQTQESDNTAADNTEAKEDPVEKMLAAGREVARLQNYYQTIVDLAGTEEHQAVANQLQPYVGETSARVEWAMIDPKKGSLQWTFNDPHQYNVPQVPVSWTLRTAAGEIMAITTATYDFATNTFSNVIPRKTISAIAYEPDYWMEGENNFTSEIMINQYLQELQEMNGNETYTPPTEQEIQDNNDIAAAREKLDALYGGN